MINHQKVLRNRFPIDKTVIMRKNNEIALLAEISLGVYKEFSNKYNWTKR